MGRSAHYVEEWEKHSIAEIASTVDYFIARGWNQQNGMYDL